MSKISTFQKQYLNGITRFFGYEKRMKFVQVDFSKPWWEIIYRFKYYYAAILFVEIILAVMYALIPFGVGFIITTGSIMYLYQFIGLWIVILILEMVTNYINPIFQSKVCESIEVSAHEFFLTVDPINHSTRSTGQVLSKIDRGVIAYSAILDTLTFEIIPLFARLITIIFALTSIPLLAIVALISIVLIGWINILLLTFNTKSTQEAVIKTQDTLKATTLENMQQVGLIRSVFNSDEIKHKLEKSSVDAASMDATASTAGTMLMSVTKLIYVCSLSILIYIVLIKIQSGELDRLIGAGLLITYFSGSFQVIRTGKTAQKFLRFYKNIQDLFEFIKGYGVQTYPVLEHDNHLKIKK
jgi:ABC-type multidrug transport system fused ATPase/permease subunit